MDDARKPPKKEELPSLDKAMDDIRQQGATNALLNSQELVARMHKVMLVDNRGVTQIICLFVGTLLLLKVLGWYFEWDKYANPPKDYTEEIEQARAKQQEKLKSAARDRTSEKSSAASQNSEAPNHAKAE